MAKTAFIFLDITVEALLFCFHFTFLSNIFYICSYFVYLLLQLFVLSCRNCNLYCIINIAKVSEDHKGKRSDTNQNFD